MSTSLKTIAISGSFIFALLASLIGCSDFVDDEDGAFNIQEGIPGDEDIPSFEVGDPCEWEDTHPWSTEGAGLDRSYRSVASGPGSLSDASFETMELHSTEVDPPASKRINLHSIAVASSGMTVVAFRDGFRSNPQFSLKAFDGSGEILWRQNFDVPDFESHPSALSSSSLTLLDSCEVALTLHDHLYLVDGREGTIESNIELHGSAFGTLHAVDGETLITATDISDDPSKLELSVQSIDRDMTSTSTIYTGSEHPFLSVHRSDAGTVYDEDSALLFLPSPGVDIGDNPDNPQASGIVGIDIETGVIETAFTPVLHESGDDHSSEFDGTFSDVHPIASDGGRIFFQADNTSLLTHSPFTPTWEPLEWRTTSHRG